MKFPRTLRAVFVFVLALLGAGAMATSAHAVGFSSSSNFSSGGGGATGGGGGGSRANVNDLTDSDGASWINKQYRLNFPEAWLNNFSAQCKINVDNTDSLHKLASSCYTKPTIYGPNAQRQSLGDVKSRGNSINRGFADRAGWRNKCAVITPVKSLATCLAALRGSTGNNSWAEVHSWTPGNPSEGPVQGTVAYIGLRVWRSCRTNGTTSFTVGGSPGLSESLSGDACTVDPIYERVPPYTDGASGGDGPSIAEYFYQRRSGSRNIWTSDPSYSSHKGLSKTSAGVLFGSCQQAVGSNKVLRLLCGRDVSTQYRTSTSSYFEDRCNNGVLGETVRWSKAEIIKQATYMKKVWSHSTVNQIINWANNNRSGSVWPPVISKESACRYFSESMTVNWSVTRSGSAKSRVRINGIPGRLYAVQTVYLDNRENILRQHFRIMSSAATVSAGGDTTECTNPYTGQKFPQGDPRCFQDPIKPSSTPGSDTPTLGAPSTIFPPAQMVGQPVDTSLKTSAESSESEAIPGEDEEIVASPEDGSTARMWAPRSLQFSLYNPSDDKTGALSGSEAETNYGKSHDLDPKAAGDPARVTTQGSGSKSVILPTPLPAGAKIYTSQIPLLANSTDNLYSNTVTVRVANPTRSLGDASDRADDTKRARADETRFYTMIGESHYLAAEPNADKVEYGPWDRLTADSCPGGQVLPEVVVGDSVTGCNPDREVKDGWRVRDAYRVPPVRPNSSPVELHLTASFQQKQNPHVPAPPARFDDVFSPKYYNSMRTNAAHFGLQSPVALDPYIVSAEVWNLDDYVNRAPGSQPEYIWAGGAKTTMNFCEPEWTRLVEKSVDIPMSEDVKMGSLRHYHSSWLGEQKTMGGDGRWWGNSFPFGAQSALFDTDRFSGTFHYTAGGGTPVSIGPDDTKWYVRKSNGAMEKVPVGSSKPSSTHSFYGWGRDWWFGPNDAGPKDVYWVKTWTETKKWIEPENYPNPDCDESWEGNNMIDVQTGQHAWGLPEGEWVAVWRLQVPGSGMPEIPHWGIVAKTQRSPGSVWRSKFDLQQDRGFTSVYRSRAVG